jgi:hypothetical protein
MFLFMALFVFQNLGASESAPWAALAGTIAGAAEPFMAQPLTTLKNRAQLARQAHIWLAYTDYQRVMAWCTCCSALFGG